MKRYHAAALMLVSLAFGTALAVAGDPGPDTLSVDHAGGGVTIYQGVLLAEESSPLDGQIQFQASEIISVPKSPDPCARPASANACTRVPFAVEIVLPDDGGEIELWGCGWRKRDHLNESGTHITLYCD